MVPQTQRTFQKYLYSIIVRKLHYYHLTTRKLNSRFYFIAFFGKHNYIKQRFKQCIKLLFGLIPENDG